VVFWDVDAPATLDRIAADSRDPFRALIPRFSAVFTYGGGDRVVNAYEALGACKCVPVYNALDPETHYSVAPVPRFQGDLAFLGNRLPDRERRVEEFFLRTAANTPDLHFLLGGAGWSDKPRSANVTYFNHVYTHEHNAFNSTPRAVLNISRESMAQYGYSPATRVFEAAGAAACIITDEWKGVDFFFDPQREILVAANADEVERHLRTLTPARAKAIGQAAYRRAIAHHTYAHRAALVEEVLEGNPIAAGAGS
jgi:spore maturation protein CgeB